MQLQIVYDGEALDNHEIDIRELSTALFGLSEIFEETNTLVNDGKAKVSVKVKASFKTGSFKIDFSAYQSILEKTTELFNSPGASAVLNASGIFTLIFGSTKGLYALLKFLAGRKADKIIENEDKSFRVYKGDKYFEAEQKLIQVYKNYKIRKAFEALISPIKKDGIDDFGIKSELDDEFVYIKKDDFQYYKAEPSADEKIDEPTIFDTNITIISLSFKEGNKWYINDGTNSYYATVEDHNFLKKIDQNEVQFSKGDVLKVTIRREQFYKPDEEVIKNINYIENVIRHIKPAQSEKLF
jgi:hypothetical protein